MHTCVVQLENKQVDFKPKYGYNFLVFLPF